MCADLLNALRGKKGAARSLYAAIFLGHTAKPQERRGSNFVNWTSRPQHRQRLLPKPPRRIPARLKPLLAALQSLLGAAQCSAIDMQRHSIYHCQALK